LDGFFAERLIRSCPSSRQASVERSSGLPFGEQSPQPSSELQPLTACGGLLARAGAAAAELVAPERCAGVRVQESLAVVPSPVPYLGQQKQVLRLGEVLQQPELGSAELPTVGSAQHHAGGCKPCAFAHTKGCENGVNCQFCHLCEPGEKKRRQKQRVARQPEVRQEARSEVRPMAGPVICQPMMSRPVLSPVVNPVVSNWQAANLRMAAVFRVY